MVVRLTGLSGAGQSSIADVVARKFRDLGCHACRLHGDKLRLGLNRDLGFSDADRAENIRRAAEVAKLMAEAGLIVIAAFISPFRKEREMARSLMGAGEFIEVHVDVPLAVSEARDVKGLYAKVRRGECPHFPGIDSPYEVPEGLELRLATDMMALEDCVSAIIGKLRDAGALGECQRTGAGDAQALRGNL
jgi:bifunctional enzyme CysN/CysC